MPTCDRFCARTNDHTIRFDVKGYRKWAFFFAVIGTNPITIYFSQRFVDFEKIAAFFLLGICQHVGLLAPLVLPLGVLSAK